MKTLITNQNGLRCLAACALTLSAGAAAMDADVRVDQHQLETVIVRAAREPVDARATGASVSILDQEYLTNRQTAALGEVLRAVPGVAMSRSGGFGSVGQVRMRGSEANHTLVFIDGVRANDASQGGGFNFAHLLNVDVEAVEVIRGPQSALWGSDAVAGVINVQTRRGDNGIDGSAYAEGGQNGWRSLGVTGRYGSERLKAAMSINQTETEGYNVSREGSEKDGYENQTLNGNFRWTATESLSLEGSLRYTDARNDFDDTDFSTGLPADSRSETDLEQLYGRVSVLLGTLDGRWRHQASLAITDTENATSSENSVAPGTFDQRSSDTELWLFTAQSSFDIVEGHTLTAAYERWEEEFIQRGEASPFGDPNQNQDITTDALVIEYRGQVTDSLSVMASARNDNNSDFDDATTSRVSVAWQLLDGDTTLRAAFGTGIKNPTFTERFGFFTNFVGNPNLQPEESTSWEAGIDQRLLDNRLQLSATWFDEQLQDEINGFAFDPALGDFTAINEDGKSQRQGLELSSSWLIADGLTVNAAYTWLDATEDDGSGGQADEIRRAEHIASANLNWNFAAGRANLNLQADYSSEQDDFFFPPVPPFQERVELDSFVIVTLAGRYRLSEQLELYARVENAGDEEYEEVLGFVAPGRTAIAGLRYSFAR